ncbi:MAG: isopeptide-forming domain-containing fimbrial protein, partial [Casimicrobium sp.]
MNLRHRIPVVISATMATSVAFAQVCSVPGRDGTGPTAGIVNTYYSPVIPSGTTLTTGASSIGLTGATGAVTALNPGDLVVVMQMQCAVINVSNTSAYGAGGASTTGRGYTNPASGCKVGTYEYVKAGPATTSSSLDLTGSPLINSYIQDDITVTNRRTFQIIRVPQYSSLTLSANVQSPYWNGFTGGVVILDVAGQLNWNGRTIDVLGRGFRGAAGIDQTFTPDTGAFPDYVVPFASDKHASKGEGIAGTPRRYWDQATGAVVDSGATWAGYTAGADGRGAPGNAGGGGDNRSAGRDNGGGGGGGNGNIGGYG